MNVAHFRREVRRKLWTARSWLHRCVAFIFGNDSKPVISHEKSRRSYAHHNLSSTWHGAFCLSFLTSQLRTLLRWKYMHFFAGRLWNGIRKQNGSEKGKYIVNICKKRSISSRKSSRRHISLFSSRGREALEVREGSSEREKSLLAQGPHLSI